MVEPGKVGNQVALPGTHLVDPPRHELSQPHEGVWVEAGGLGVVKGCGVFTHPFFEKWDFGSFSEGSLGPPNQRGRWNVRAHGRYMEDQWEKGEPFMEGEGEVS